MPKTTRAGIQSSPKRGGEHAAVSGDDHLRGGALQPAGEQRPMRGADGGRIEPQAGGRVQGTAQPHQPGAFGDWRDGASGVGQRARALPCQPDGAARTQYRGEPALGVEWTAVYVRKWRLGGRGVRHGGARGEPGESAESRVRDGGHRYRAFGGAGSRREFRAQPSKAARFRIPVVARDGGNGEDAGADLLRSGADEGGL